VYDATGGRHPVIAATYSRALVENGNAKEALSVAKQGLDTAQDDNTRTLLKSAIERAEKAGTGAK
jgi:hypothetical protein